MHGDLGVLLHSVHHGMFRFTGMEALEPFVAWGAGLGRRRDAPGTTWTRSPRGSRSSHPRTPKRPDGG